MSGVAQPDVVTGDAVVLDLRLAKLASRSLALAVDLAVQIGLGFAVFALVGGLLGRVDTALAAAIGLVSYVLVIVGYPVIFETATRGRTLGKLAFGLRVVREDGGPIRFRHAVVRGLLSLVEIWLTFGALALFSSLASARGKRLGDFLAGTVVVRERMPVSAAAVAPMPPPLAAWATGLDLTRLPGDLALAARQFLSRRHELAPTVRQEMGARLATSVAAVTTPPPPPGTPSWAFLAAVLAERRRREMLRHGLAPDATSLRTPSPVVPAGPPPPAATPQTSPPTPPQVAPGPPAPSVRLPAVNPDQPRAPGGFSLPG